MFQTGMTCSSAVEAPGCVLVENLGDGFIFRGDLKQQQTFDQLKIDKTKKDHGHGQEVRKINISRPT